jgi:hypothetical protein
VYRWDLDKTYLETDFDTVRGLVRTALEPASRKRATPGATVLMRELGKERPGWRPRIVILSGSPTQMRGVLEDKLRMDGVRWDQLVLKDTVRSLRKGRLRAVRGQLGYKLPALFAGRVGLGSAARETCFGDDAESDAVAYSLYADAIAGRIGAAELAAVMEAAGAYSDEVVAALAALRRVAHADAVERIFIRLARGKDPAAFAALGPRVVPVRGWFQAAVVMGAAAELEPRAVASVLAASGLEEAQAADACADIVARGHVADGGLARALAEVRTEWVGEVIARAAGEYRDPREVVRVDYLAVVRG